MNLPKILLLFATLIFTFSCQEDDTFNNEIDRPFDNPDIEDPDNGTPDNGVEISEAALGKLLFWDPILSGEMDIACASCHHPDFGYSDGRALSIGVGGQGLGPNRFDAVNDDISLVQRNAPTIINTAFNGMDVEGDYDPDLAPMFWDNRALSLEAQALGPLLSFEEMRGHAFSEELAFDSIVARLENNTLYKQYFSAVYGINIPISSENIGAAIAAFERTITATNSAFDRFTSGDESAMTNAQIRGMNRFDEIGCDDCHSGPMFSDFELHTLGVPDNNQLSFSDEGANGTYAFRTPTLRNLNETGPYFHNGVGGDLRQTIQFYITARNFANNNGPGGGGPGGPNGLSVNPNVNRGDIDDEVRDLENFGPNQIEDIIAFIEALNDPDFDRSIPSEVPSGLIPGGNIQ
jgi:cytochrome c peroxidase